MSATVTLEDGRAFLLTPTGETALLAMLIRDRAGTVTPTDTIHPATRLRLAGQGFILPVADGLILSALGRKVAAVLDQDGAS